MSFLLSSDRLPVYATMLYVEMQIPGEHSNLRINSFGGRVNTPSRYSTVWSHTRGWFEGKGLFHTPLSFNRDAVHVAGTLRRRHRWVSC
jgi:hypothetical protein